MKIQIDSVTFIDDDFDGDDVDGEGGPGERVITITQHGNEILLNADNIKQLGLIIQGKLLETTCCTFGGMTLKQIKKRLEYLRGEIRGECISYGEIAELTCYADFIEPGDVELLQWAGVPEFPDDPE